jgi:hypothetical protein
MRGTTIFLLALLSAGAALAAPFTRAQYGVVLSAVQALNSPQTPAGGSNDQQASYDPQPAKVDVYGSAEHFNVGLGYANGAAHAVASPGVLRASTWSEAQAVARPDSNVGAGVVATALAEFSDEVFVTPSRLVYQNLLIVKGVLRLTGNMHGVGSGGGYTRVTVGGTGLHPQQSSAEWWGEPGRQYSPVGGYSDWTPGDPTEIPFEISAYANQATEIHYWLSVRSDSGGSFPACPAFGGLCEVIQIGEHAGFANYSNTLSWHVTSVTDWNGASVGYSIASTSGFDYAPEPGALASMLVALGAIGGLRRTRGRPAGSLNLLGGNRIGAA